MELEILELILNIFITAWKQKSVRHQEPVVESWSCTQKNEVRFRHIWTIDKLSSSTGNMATQAFTVEERNAIKFSLVLCTEYDGFSLLLHLVSSKVPNVHVSAKVSVLQAPSAHIKHQSAVLKHDECIQFRPYVSKHMLLADARSLWPNGRLTISCEGTTMVDDVTITGTGTMVHANKSHECELANDFEHLLETGTLSDVTLYVHGKEIRAHKTILAARSRVFSAMFEHDMLESQQNKVEIQDIDANVFMDMLRFIYTGRTKDVHVPALLLAATKYNLEQLENICKMKLFANISLTNACESLIVADALGYEPLKKRAINFINLNANKISKTIQFQSMITKYPNLVVDLYSTMY